MLHILIQNNDSNIRGERERERERGGGRERECQRQRERKRGSTILLQRPNIAASAPETYHSVLLIASPKPGVSTRVNFRLTPPSFKYTVDVCT